MVLVTWIRPAEVTDRGEGWEVFRMNITRPVFGVGKTRNIFGVPRVMWRKWREEARWMFNSVLLECRGAGWEFMSHPSGPKLSEEHADTPFWNAAVIAADAKESTIRSVLTTNGIGRPGATIAIDHVSHEGAPGGGGNVLS